MSKQLIHSLLKKGSLTGEEAGRIMLQDFISRLESEEGALTENEARQLINSLKNTDSKKIYYGFVNLAEIFKNLFTMVQVNQLEVSKNILNLQTIVLYQFLKRAEQNNMSSLPIIMSEKEYKDTCKQHFAKAKMEIHTLEDIFLDRLVLYYYDKRKTVVPEIWDEYSEEQLEKIDCAHDYYRHTKSGLSALRDEFPKLYELVHNDIKKLFTSNKFKAKMPFTQISLEDYHLIEFTGEDMLKTNFPEIKLYFHLEEDWGIDENYDLRGIAIVKDPQPHQVDENGHFQKEADDDNWITLSDEQKQVLNDVVDIISKQVQRFYAYYNSLVSIAHIVGIDYSTIQNDEESIQNIISSYNSIADSFNYPWLPVPDYKIFELDKLRPTDEVIEKFKKDIKSISFSDYGYLTEDSFKNKYYELVGEVA